MKPKPKDEWMDEDEAENIFYEKRREERPTP